tara:strand:+ start:183 stop:374 length:192 start_codon:yes stop_codon:yes gene_type:complete
MRKTQRLEHMDRELETYIEKTMNEQIYRNGIFDSLIERFAAAIAFYRSGVDRRGAHHSRKGAY